MPLQLHDVVRRLLSDPEAGWSMGSFGALAEFHHDPGEAALVDHPDRLTRATARGAIRINREYLGRALPVATRSQVQILAAGVTGSRCVSRHRMRGETLGAR